MSVPDPETTAVKTAARRLILGTAGHIDHGKTTLIRALTGTDTDRLPEEKKRGLTIELGFAELPLDGVTYGVVDVPGHERFVRTMVAGATGIDVACIVVAADDAVMPQTIEHVQVLDLLGVRRAVVAITKCDMVEPDLIDLVEEDIRELLARTGLKGAEVVRVAAPTGLGVDDLRAELQRLAEEAESAGPEWPFRLPVDRVFTVAGRGTVVTGSVASGKLHVDKSVDIWPQGLIARVREIQVHGRPSEVAIAGQRAALNLQGISREELERGCELAEVGVFQPSRFLDVELHCLADHQRPIRRNARFRVCIGAREVMARCVTLDAAEIAPGETGFAQLRCREPVVAAFNQHFIVRDENAARTAGGGVVLRVARGRTSSRQPDAIAALQRLRDGNADDRLVQAVTDAGCAPLSDIHLAVAAGVTPDHAASRIGPLIDRGALVRLDSQERPLSAAWLESFTARIVRWLHAYHERRADEPGCLTETLQGWIERRSNRAIARYVYKRLVADKRIRIMGRYACHAEFAPNLSQQDERILAQVLEAMNSGAFQPPGMTELIDATGANKSRLERLLKIAVAMGSLVAVSGEMWLHADREQELRRAVDALYAEQGPFKLTDLRERINSTRKYAVPIAEYLDRNSITVRQGDLRTPANGQERDKA